MGIKLKSESDSKPEPWHVTILSDSAQAGWEVLLSNAVVVVVVDAN